MATSDFKIFANGQSLVGEETLNIAPLDDEQLVTETKTGFYSGLASSKKFNRVLRQGTAGTATIADLIVEVLAEDVKDDGTPLKEQLRRAITKTVELDTKSFVRTINGVAPDASGDAVGGDTLNAEILAACDKALTDTTDTQNDEFINSFAEKLRSIGTLHALGDTWISFDSTVPAGGVPFCGQLVSRDLWADLYAWATAQGKVKTESEWQEYATAHGGNCPFYSDGDGGGTFRMPKVASYFKGAESVDEGGTWIAEGLPNITGSWPVDSNGLAAFSGAVYSNGAADGASGASSNNLKAQLDASRSSSIYGNSSHVTPETCVVLVGVWALGNISTTGNTTIDAVASAVASIEANIAKGLPDSTVHIIETWVSEDGDSWYRKYSDGWIEQGGRVNRNGAGQDIVTFNTAFTNSSSLVVTLGTRTTGFSSASINCIKTISTTSMTVWNGSYVSDGCFWHACGY